MAGKNLTQANVIADNKLTDFTAGGLTGADQLGRRRPHGQRAAVLRGLHQVKGDKYVPALNTGKNVFNCFESINAKKPRSSPCRPARRPAKSTGKTADSSPARTGMEHFLGFALPGIPYGCTYAIVAVGLVLTYQATGVFNFAFGAQAFAAAFVFTVLTQNDNGRASRPSWSPWW
jgi:hypothetical protein